MTRFVVKPFGKDIILQKRNSRRCTVIARSPYPDIIEAALDKEKANMDRLGLKYKVFSYVAQVSE